MMVIPQGTSSLESMKTYKEILIPTSFKYLQESRICNSVRNKDCFSVTVQATTE